jgi:Amt family ammonium transporter
MGGTGTVFLVAAGFSLAALLVWLPRKGKRPLTDPELPPVQNPLLAVSGALLLFAGAVGWSWSNPIQAEVLGELGAIRGSINVILAGAGGVVIPLLYTWFVAGNSHPLMSARGVAAGVIAGLAAGPFVTPGSAMLIGLLAGASLPFVTFAVDRLVRLDDAAGIIAMTGVPAVIGLVAIGIWADGSVGSGWQLTGVDNYLGIMGQGVSGLLVASGYQVDFPGQIQAQVIGVTALALWGFLLGAIVCLPLSVIFQGLEAAARIDAPRAAPGGQAGPLPTPGSLALESRPGNVAGASPAETGPPRGAAHPQSGYGPERKRR